jgi:hypothetical protein
MQIALLSVTRYILGTAFKMHVVGVSCNLVIQSLIESYNGFASKNLKLKYNIQLTAQITTVVFTRHTSHFSLELFGDECSNAITIK